MAVIKIKDFSDKIKNFLDQLIGEKVYVLDDKGVKQITPEEYKEYQKTGAEPTVAPTQKQAPTPTPSPQMSPDDLFAGITTRKPTGNTASLIQSNARERNLDPNLLAALLMQESGYNPQAVGAVDKNDRGIAQINKLAFPNVTDEQAFDPQFAIAFAAKKLADDIAYFDNVSRGIAAYNVGRGGANIKGPEKFGGGPKGQQYINNVSRNLSEDMIRKLGIITDF